MRVANKVLCLCLAVFLLCPSSAWGYVGARWYNGGASTVWVRVIPASGSGCAGGFYGVGALTAGSYTSADACTDSYTAGTWNYYVYNTQGAYDAANYSTPGTGAYCAGQFNPVVYSGSPAYAAATITVCSSPGTTNYVANFAFTNTATLGGDYRVRFYTNGVQGGVTQNMNLGPGDAAGFAMTNVFGAGVPFTWVVTGPGDISTDFVPQVVSFGSATGTPGASGSTSGNVATTTDVDSVARSPSYTPASTNQLVADRQNTESLRATLSDGFNQLRTTLQAQGTNGGGGSSVTNAPDYSAVLSAISSNTLSSAQQLGAATNLLTAVTNLLPRYEQTNSVNPTTTAAGGEAAAYSGGGSSLSNNAGSLVGRTFTAAPSSGPNWNVTIRGHTVSMNPVGNADVALVCAWVRYVVTWAAAVVTVWLVFNSVFAAILAVPGAQQTKGVTEQTPVLGTIGTIISSFGFRVAIVALLGAATVVFWSSWLTSNASIWTLVLSGEPFGTGFGTVVTHGIWLLDQFCPVVTILTDISLVLGSKLSLGAAVFIKTMAVRWFPS